MVATTLSAAVAANDTQVQVAAATGISAAGSFGEVQTQLKVDDEFMSVRSLSSTVVQVIRGVRGSPIQAHSSGAQVLVLSPGEIPVSLEPPIVSSKVMLYITNPQTIATATAVTLTAEQILSGIILQDPAGGAVTTTLPTAALLDAAIRGLIGDVPIGLSFRFTIRNTADAAETITVAVGTGGTGSGTLTIAQSNSKEFLVRITGVGGSAAYTLYSLGTIVT